MSAGLGVSSTSRPIRLAVERICKSFGEVAALSDVSLNIREGEIHAICGENGSGKSTFVKILTGLHLPDAGSILINERPVRFAQPQDAEAHGIAVVAQELSLCPDLTVLDNIWLGSRQVPLFHKRASLARKAEEALSSLGVTDIRLDQFVSELEIGQRQLVEIARMLARDAELLILDEPTATLSDRDIDRLFTALAALRNAGRSIIYITHRLAEVFRLCDTVTVFRNGKLVETRPSKNFDRDSLIESMLGRPLENMYPAQTHHDGDVALVIENLNVPGILSDFNLTVRRNAITCLVGQVGSGAVDIIKAVAGLVYDAGGSIMVNGRKLPLGSPMAALDAGIMYISGDRAQEGLFLHLSVADNLVATRLNKYARFGLLSPENLRRAARQLADRVGVNNRRLGSPISELSGGNQQKVAFGRCIDNHPAGVLAMIEPTRGVDVGARAEIYLIMREFCESGYSVFMTSSDLEEVHGIADVAVTMFRGRQVRQLHGSDLTVEQMVYDITHPEVPTESARQ